MRTVSRSRSVGCHNWPCLARTKFAPVRALPPTYILATMNGLFKLRLLPPSLERSALLAQFEAEERYAVECAQIACDEERERVEEEWKKGRQRVRERLLEGIEERRRRAREEKEGEGTVGGWVSFYFISAINAFIHSFI